MYGKLHADMFTGSMMGTGALSFAVMGYVIANQQPDRERKNFYVELRPRLMAVLIGEPEGDIQKKIDDFCGPDEESRSLERGDETWGKKLIKEGAFTYLVVNGAYYDGLRRQADKQEKDRIRQARCRGKKNGDSAVGEYLPSESESLKASKEWAPTPEQIRLAAILRRKPETSWDAKELKAYRSIGPISEEDFQKLEAYYRYRPKGEDTMYRKTKFSTFIADFNGQLEKARAWREPREY